MSDLLSVLLYVLRDEVDAFWCFVGLMETWQYNFSEDQLGMQGHLCDLHSLLRFLNAPMMEYLEETGSDNMYFCFRWILVLFKREFSMDALLSVWDVLLACHGTKKYHLFVALALMEPFADRAMRERLPFDELLALVAANTGAYDAPRVLMTAEALFTQFSQYRAVTQDVRGLVTLHPEQALAVTTSTTVAAADVTGHPGTASGAIHTQRIVTEDDPGSMSWLSLSTAP